MDVNFIEENCSESSITIVIDSELRNKDDFPNPNKYVVEFDQPIKNVFGFEILDSAVPVSLYSVENNNNSLSLGVFFTITTPLLKIYSDIENILQYDIDFQDIFEAPESGNVFVVEGENVNTLVESMYPDVDKNTTGTNIIFCINNGNITSKRYIDISPNVSYDETGNIILTNDNDISIPIDYIISLSYIIIPSANYDSLSMLKYLRSIDYFKNTVITSLMQDRIITKWYDNVASTSQSLTQQYSWTLNSSYSFFFDMKKSTICDVFGFQDVNPSLPFRYKANKNIFVSSINTDYNEQIISSHGLLVFQGTKYITLRCPEIESHVLGSYSTLKQGLGLAVFKLTTTNSIAFLRFDFYNIIRKKFHPIGKLSRLTFSFEDKYGNLYNFKGMNHFVLAEIKYYIPKQTNKEFVPILNPQYNPDILKYEMLQLELKENKSKKYNIDDVMREHNKYVRSVSPRSTPP
jgi:hypothetical protein